MGVADLLASCEHCPHMLGHHGPQGCEHTPGYDDPHSDPATYAGEARDCDCDHPVKQKTR